jgi:hypothetical protein
LKDDILFIAYDLDLDLWLEGRLKGFGRFFFQDYGTLGLRWLGRPPAFLHLEKQRFCLLQYADDDYVRCVVVDVSHMPQEKSLIYRLFGIKIMQWNQKYVVDTHCFNILRYTVSFLFSHLI